MEIKLTPINQRPGNKTPADITIRLHKIGDTFECYGSSAIAVNENLNTSLQIVNGQYYTKFPIKQADILFPRLVRLGYKIAIR